MSDLRAVFGEAEGAASKHAPDAQESGIQSVRLRIRRRRTVRTVGASALGAVALVSVVSLGVWGVGIMDDDPAVPVVPQPSASPTTTPSPSPTPSATPEPSPSPVATEFAPGPAGEISDEELAIASADDGWFLAFFMEGEEPRPAALVVSPDGRTRSFDIPLEGELSAGLWTGTELIVVDWGEPVPDRESLYTGGLLYTVDLVAETVRESIPWDGPPPSRALADGHSLAVGGCCGGTELTVFDASRTPVFDWFVGGAPWLITPDRDAFVYLDEHEESWDHATIELVTVALDGAELSRVQVEGDWEPNQPTLEGWLTDSTVGVHQWQQDFSSVDVATGQASLVDGGWVQNDYVFETHPATGAVATARIGFLAIGAPGESPDFEAVQSGFVSEVEFSPSGGQVLYIETFRGETEPTVNQEMERHRVVLVDLGSGTSFEVAEFWVDRRTWLHLGPLV